MGKVVEDASGYDEPLADFGAETFDCNVGKLIVGFVVVAAGVDPERPVNPLKGFATGLTADVDVKPVKELKGFPLEAGAGVVAAGVAEPAVESVPNDFRTVTRRRWAITSAEARANVPGSSLSASFNASTSSCHLNLNIQLVRKEMQKKDSTIYRP